MKDWLKNFGITALIAVLVIFLIIWLAYTIIILKNDPGLANAYVAIGTLILATVTAVLAGFTYLNIKSGDAREERDREERLLNEIIEWAEEIDKASLIPAIQLTSKNTELRRKEYEANVLRIYGISLSKATSMETITIMRFEDELLKDVRKVLNTLVKFICIKQLKSLGVMPTEKAIPAKARREIKKEIEKGRKSIEQLWDEYTIKLAKSNRDLLFKENQIKANLL